MAPGNRKNPQRSTASESQYTLLEFMRDFPDDESCLEWLWLNRCATSNPNQAHCPRCEEVREFKRYGTKQQRQSWTCTACGLHIHPTAGTIFHKSSTGLHLWFYAMYLMTSTRCGISAKQLERELGVTYKTAWRMFHLIRNELMTQDVGPMVGAVEMDETWIGGKARLADKASYANAPSRISAAHKWADENTTAVFGVVQRKTTETSGTVAAYVVPSVKTATLQPHIAAHVKPGTIIYTDEGKSYRNLKNEGWDHRTITHKTGIYVSGDIHTQTIEGFWSLVKRGISGTHHAVSPKYLQGYVNEYVWRHNHREDGRSMFGSLILRAAEG
jgi:transposase